MSTFQVGSSFSWFHQPYKTGLNPICGIASNTAQARNFTDLNRKVLALGLCWFHWCTNAREPRRKMGFPSWSWAGWESLVAWPLSHEAGLDEFVVQSEVLELVRLPTQRNNDLLTPLRQDFTGIKILAKCFPKELFEFTSHSWKTGYLSIFKHSFRFTGEDPHGLAPHQFVAGLEAGEMICVLVGGQSWSSIWPKRGTGQFFYLHILVLATVATASDSVLATERVGFLRFRHDCRTPEGQGTPFGLYSLPEITSLPLKELLIL
ncbi:hypothetical protein BKA56DRAFT_585883 [Ilyonectria sp. MPI-CAGE-AT-0026]|nr:hypothetical protein BKA56DRAFT_585883 [Ilyonectria sp. MPI-CAGE-AT-0026]